MARRYAYGGFGLVVGLCGWVAVVQAQSAQSQDTVGTTSPGDAAQQAATVMAPVSVTATRNPIEVFDYPGMVTVVGPDELNRRQGSTPDDILQFVPGVEFTSGPRRTGEVPSIRGFDGPDVVLLIDGARQNFGSAHDGRFFIDPSMLRQVEVLRGSSSSLYGSGGTGGVIEFRTIEAADKLKPGEVAGATATVGYQSVNDELAGNFTAYAMPIEGLDLVGSVTLRDSNDIKLGDGTKLRNTDDDIISGLIKGSFSFAQHHEVEASFLRFDNDAKEPNNGQANGSDIVEKDIVADTYRAAYSYSNPSDNLLDLDVVAYHTDFTADELRLTNLGTGPAGQLLKRDVNTTGFRIDNRSRLALMDDLHVTLTYGGEYYHDEQNGAAGSGERDGVPDATADFYGIFGQAEIEITEPFGVVPGTFLIIPGLRFDGYSADSDLADSTDEQKLSPRIGVSYMPTDWSLLFMSYGAAFRAPTFDELYLTGTHFTIPALGITNRFVPNPNLTPQETDTLEFGGGLSFEDVAMPGDLFQVKASHYVTWGRDFIDQTVVQPAPFVNCNPFIPGNCDGTTSTFNVPRALLWGAEVEASYENDRARIALGFSTIDGENRDTGAKLGVLTPDQFTVDTALKLPEIDSIIGWRIFFAEDFDNVNTPTDARESYVLHDIYFAWQPLEGVLSGLRVELGIDNIFDAEYTRVSSQLVEQGRNFKGQVSYSVAW